MIRSIFFFLISCIAGLLTVMSIRTFHPAVLNPEGSIASQEYLILTKATLLMLVVVIPVLILTFFVAWRYRKGAKNSYTPDWDYNGWIELIWWGIPCIIIILLSILTWKSSHELDPFKTVEREKPPLKIEVIALRWKWLFIYPEYNIATVNYLQFPQNRPIQFEITSDAPMNSFWIPALGGQIYAMPGMRTKLSLIADRTGVYQGASANLSGHGFSGMKFQATSLEEPQFQKWVETVQSAPNKLNMERYQELLSPSEYEAQASYQLDYPSLFDWVVMKYMMPEEKDIQECTHEK